MAKSFIWNNGSQDSPVVLTDNELDILTRAGNKAAADKIRYEAAVATGENNPQREFTCEVGGYITRGTGKIFKYQKISLERMYPNLHIVAEEMADKFNIEVDSNYMIEGSSNKITIRGIEGSTITHEYLNYDIEIIDSDIESGDINLATIKNRISVVDGFIVCEKPRENATWYVDVKVTAYPNYFTEADKADSNNAASMPRIYVRISAVAIENITATIDNEIPIKTSFVPHIIPQNNNTTTINNGVPTKLNGATYKYDTDTQEYVSTVGDDPRTRDTVTPANTYAKLTIQLMLAGTNNVLASTTVQFSVFDLRPTSFIIDQRSIANTQASRSMVGVNYYKDSEGNKHNLSSYAAIDSETRNVITWIRKNSHAFVGKWDGTLMELKQLSDTDRTMFADGTSALNYIIGANDTNRFTYDVWMMFKSDIYIKTEAVIPDDAEVVNDDYIEVTISKDKPEDYINDSNNGGWFKYDKNHLIAVYPMTYDDKSVPRSISGRQAKNNVSMNDCFTRAKNRGGLAKNGMSIINYNAHRVIAFLCYGYYGTLNIQDVCGFGTVNAVDGVYYGKKTGLTNHLAMTDTTNDTGLNTSGNGTVDANTQDGKLQIQQGYGDDIKSVNIWNLENWYGDLSEWQYDLIVMCARRPESSATPKASVYLDDYIDNYVAGHGGDSIQITKDGKDFTLTKAMLEDYAEQHRFIKITDRRGSVIRIIQTPFTTNFDSYVKQMQFGKYADLTPKLGGGNSEIAFADYCCVYGAGGVARRGDNSATANGGVAFLYLVHGAGYSDSSIGSRLLFEGTDDTIQIVDNFS